MIMNNWLTELITDLLYVSKTDFPESIKPNSVTREWYHAEDKYLIRMKLMHSKGDNGKGEYGAVLDRTGRSS